MKLPMVDCRSLIEFCRAFEQHKNMANSLAASDHRPNYSHYRNKKHDKSLNPLGYRFCEHSPLAAVDVIILFFALGALGFLIVPYIKLIYRETVDVLPAICDRAGDAIRDAPVAYLVGLVGALTGVIATIAVWEILDMRSRKCGNPHCKGLRKAVEFDIQLESEECAKFLYPVPATGYQVKQLELGRDHEELEAELKKMAPLNGRAVLIFRASCGCPKGRLEVWGPKKIRRKK